MIDVILPVYATTDQLVDMAWEALSRLDGARRIVVDNGWHLDRRFPCEVYVRLGENQGYAGGVNAGLELATAEAIVVGSIDVYVRPGWHRLVEVALERGGIATPQAERYLDGEPTGDFELPDCDYWGGIFAMPREVYSTIGGMDTEHFRLRHGDTDYAIRAAKAGIWVGRVPEVVVEHRDPSMSTLLMGEAAVAEEFERLQQVHGPFEVYEWKASDW
jgi:GT2 family glycosyltransferase